MSVEDKRTDGGDVPPPSVPKIAVVELVDEDNGWLSSEAILEFARNLKVDEPSS